MSAFIGKVKKKIPKVNLQAMNLHTGHRLFLCFLLGIVVGTLLINVLLGDYAKNIGIYSEYFVNRVNINEGTAYKTDFFIYCIKKYIGEFLIIQLLNMTPMGMLFNRLYCIYKGMVIAMLISSATLTYGALGIILYLISIFPHYILYVPFIVSTLYISLKIAQMVKEHKTERIKIRAIVIVLLLVAGTAFLEAFVNLPIIKIAFC